MGGSARIPRIQQLVQEYFVDKEVLQSINPDGVLAYGAAIQVAEMLAISPFLNMCSGSCNERCCECYSGLKQEKAFHVDSFSNWEINCMMFKKCS